MDTMKLLLKILFFLLIPVFVTAQIRRPLDSAYFILQHAENDTVRMGVYSWLGGYYDDISVDSGLFYCNKGIAIAEKLDLQLNKAMTLAFMAWPLMKTGNYPEALKVINQGFKIAEDPFNKNKAGYLPNGQTLKNFRLYVIGLLHGARESLYGYVGDYEKQIATAREAIPYAEAAGDIFNLAGLYPDIGDGYLKLNKPDSALFYQQKSLEFYPKLPFEDRKFEGGSYTSIGMIYETMGNTHLARENYLKAIQISELHENFRHAGNASLQLANLYQSLNKADSSFLYAQKALTAFLQGGYKKEVAIAYRMISDYYGDKQNRDSSFAYLKWATILDDSLDMMEKAKLQEFQVAAFNQQLQFQQQEQEQIEREGKQKTITIIALIAVFSIIGLLLYRNNRQKQKANHILQEKNTEIERTLNDLKTTQKQLIQSEKMASLGELTAGIAHEIQNPLNFVNNFSEVSKELIEEVKSERSKVKSERDEVLEEELLNDISQNLEKINHHGKRADAIVKGMLQHSRSSSGQKEPTDINVLCDEYLRLAWHGLKAKDPSFNASFHFEPDDTLPNINVVPQDIGRVLLNLINNAFQAVGEKVKSETANVKGESSSVSPSTFHYEPLVTVSTKKLGDRIQISVKDNGSGIPDSIKEKIFQPFFTTKPTGQGTGLGLSLSYDIIKAHGGELKVETKESEGSTFTIQIPVS
jgi:two-component system, NtrC family, sensor kinase